MSSTINQQPIRRTVGRRQLRDGHSLTAADRAALANAGALPHVRAQGRVHLLLSRRRGLGFS
jgi:hypothetical protein